MKRLSLALLLPLVLAAGCPKNAFVAADDDDDDDDSGSAAVPDAGTPDAGTPVCELVHGGGTTFQDKTTAWDLTGVTGNRLTTADLDGDGYPDLVISSNYPNRRSSKTTAPFLVRVLMNRPATGGGRHFVDQTDASGVFQVRGGSTTEYRSAHVAAYADVDNDGDLDIFSGTYVDPTHPETDTGDRSEILLNDGTGHFTLAPLSDPHPEATQRWPTSGATFLDADRDGVIDLFVGFWYRAYGQSSEGVQAQLYGGLGDGTFNTITVGAGLQTRSSSYSTGKNHRPAYGVTSCDVDGDGAPDLMISAYGRQWNMLYLNAGDGTFVEMGQESGYAGDDNRSYADNEFFRCYCTLHATQEDCVGVRAPSVQCPNPADGYWSPGSDDQPWRLNGNTFTTVCSDMDGDGKLDLYSAEIHHWHIGQSSDSSELLHNTSTPGYPSFTRPGNAATGMVWPHPTTDWNEGGIMAAAADLDRDGQEDVLVGASDYPDQFSLLFHGLGGGTFEEVGQDWGLHHACTVGLAVADFDRDGDLDVVVGSGTARDCSAIWTTNEVHIYENHPPAGTHWLSVRLKGDGVHANTTGIGARVTVSNANGSIMKELTGGYGHMGMQQDTTLFFGLGACATVETVTVRWPDGSNSVQTFKNVAADQFVELRQGDATVHPVALR